jgi:hypothetical protein
MRDAEPARQQVRRGKRREAGHKYVWIRVGGAWRSGVIAAWFRQEEQWCCWVQHDHPDGRPWSMWEMYVYDPVTIIPRDPWQPDSPPQAASQGTGLPDLG